jgi:hypothetical protein
MNRIFVKTASKVSKVWTFCHALRDDKGASITWSGLHTFKSGNELEF